MLNPSTGQPPTLVLVPERFVAGGAVLARDDGKVVFVEGAVPGDTVRVEITESKSDFARGHVIEVIEPGPGRVEPPCSARQRGCGGCDWQHVRAGSQPNAKVEIVADALRRTAKLPDADITAGESVPSVGYRTTLRAIGDERGRPAFREAQSHQPIAFDECLVAHPLLNEALAEAEIPNGIELTVRVSVANSTATAHWDFRLGEPRGLPVWVNDDVDANLVEVVAGHPLQVSAASFFQSGPAAAELLVDAVRRAAPELATATRVVDAYAGVGLFAIAAPGPDAHVVMIESSKSAHLDAKVNAEMNHRSASFELGEVGAWKPARGREIDVVIADPARTGLGKPGTAALARAQAPVMVVVSCDPVALARDVGLLARLGYQHVNTEVIDAFPMTHHIETVTRFERSS